MQNKLLTREIIRHIFACFGVIVPLGQAGLTVGELLTKKSVRMAYDNGEEISHKVYAGQIVFQESKFRALMVDLTADAECPEFCLLFRFDSLPLHGLRLSYDDEDFGVFRILGDKDVWKEASMTVQSSALNGIERLVSFGFPWTPCDQIDDLFKAALVLVES